MSRPMATYVLNLSSAGNPDFDQDPTRPLPGVPTRTVTVQTLAEASQVTRAYIREHTLGAGSFTGGQIYEGDREVARVSYNGSVWPAEPWTPALKPLFVPEPTR